MIINLKHRCSPTIFCDIDGTIWRHDNDVMRSLNGKQKLLPGVFDCFLDWHRQGWRIFLTTGRPAALREETELQLRQLGIFYTQLVMDCGPGPRVLINDMESTSEDIKFKAKAQAVNLIRDNGMEELEINYTQEKDL